MKFRSIKETSDMNIGTELSHKRSNLFEKIDLKEDNTYKLKSSEAAEMFARPE